MIFDRLRHKTFHTHFKNPGGHQDHMDLGTPAFLIPLCISCSTGFCNPKTALKDGFVSSGLHGVGAQQGDLENTRLSLRCEEGEGATNCPEDPNKDAILILVPEMVSFLLYIFLNVLFTDHYHVTHSTLLKQCGLSYNAVLSSTSHGE
jgi:hypothetical protein